MPPPLFDLGRAADDDDDDEEVLIAPRRGGKWRGGSALIAYSTRQMRHAPPSLPSPARTLSVECVDRSPMRSRGECQISGGIFVGWVSRVNFTQSGGPRCVSASSARVELTHRSSTAFKSQTELRLLFVNDSWRGERGSSRNIGRGCATRSSQLARQISH